MHNLPSKPELSDDLRRAFAPKGVLRMGLAVGNTISAVWTMPDPETGAPKGPSVDLGVALAEWLGLRLEYVHLASSGEIIASADADRWDFAFTPVDAERKKVVDFTTNFYLGESTYLVRADSGLERVADVDAKGVRVVGVENTATLRSARRTLSLAHVTGVNGPQDAIALFCSGEAEAVALGRESLLSLAAILPDVRILPDHFHAAGTALAMPKGRGKAVAIATDFIEAAKGSDLVERIVVAHGLPATSVAPAGSRS